MEMISIFKLIVISMIYLSALGFAISLFNDRLNCNTTKVINLAVATVKTMMSVILIISATVIIIV